ncbi:MAG: copper resistance protein CopC, partial [Ilumatobacteraceae bacterium]
MRAATTWVLALLAGLLLAMHPGGADAHTGLESSSPADGDSVEAPLRSIVLEFTGTPTAIDGGIVVAGDDGASYEPTAVMQDGTTITAFFEPPLGAGAYATTWIVRSDDTHTITDSFAFTVTAPAATTTVAPSTSVESAPSTSTPPATTEAPAVASTEPPAAEPEVEDAAPAAAPVDPPAAEGVVAPAVPPAVQAIEDGESTARIGRLILYPAAVVAIGILAFAAYSYAGRGNELGALVRLVRWLGVAVVIGAVIELVGLEPVYGGWGELAAEDGGRAAIARAVAGACLACGVGPAIGSPPAGGASPTALSAAVLEGDEAPPLDDAEGRWRPTSHPAALVGVALLLVSFAFDGHTLSEGPRVVHALASVAHVAAASVWAGGLIALAVVLWRRYRAEVPSRSAQMVTRFSVVAMGSVGIAGLAGLLMAWFIEDDLGAYTSTD